MDETDSWPGRGDKPRDGPEPVGCRAYHAPSDARHQSSPLTVSIWTRRLVSWNLNGSLFLLNQSCRTPGLAPEAKVLFDPFPTVSVPDSMTVENRSSRWSDRCPCVLALHCVYASNGREGAAGCHGSPSRVTRRPYNSPVHRAAPAPSLALWRVITERVASGELSR